MSLYPSVFLRAILCSTRDEARQRGKQALLLLLRLTLSWVHVDLLGFCTKHVQGSKPHFCRIENCELFLYSCYLLNAWAHLVAFLGGRVAPAQVVTAVILRLVEVFLCLVTCLRLLLAPVAMFIRLYSTPPLDLMGSHNTYRVRS